MFLRCPRCVTCIHLKSFELTDDLFTCVAVNIRLHASSIRTFGCTLHERRERPAK